MVDEADSKSVASNRMWVQVPPPAPFVALNLFKGVYMICSSKGRKFRIIASLLFCTYISVSPFQAMNSSKIGFENNSDGVYCPYCSEASDSLCFKPDISKVSGNLSDLLSIALTPVGISLYVWGGEHGLASNAFRNVDGGIHPLSKDWIEFAAQQDSNYDSDHDKMSAEQDHSLIPNGMDCSALIGYIVRQFWLLSDPNNKYILNHGLTKNSTWYVPMLSKIGLGTDTSARELEKIEDFNERYHPGDILGGDRSLGEGNFMGHVYMVIGC